MREWGQESREIYLHIKIFYFFVIIKKKENLLDRFSRKEKELFFVNLQLLKFQMRLSVLGWLEGVVWHRFEP